MSFAQYNYCETARSIIMTPSRSCRHFGYVNFLAEDEAETAARSLSGFQIEYHSIKTKGPKKLKEEKHLQVHVSPSSGRQMFDYRPLTDCSFGQSCKKGQKVSSNVLLVAIIAKSVGLGDKKCCVLMMY